MTIDISTAAEQLASRTGGWARQGSNGEYIDASDIDEDCVAIQLGTIALDGEVGQVSLTWDEYRAVAEAMQLQLTIARERGWI